MLFNCSILTSMLPPMRSGTPSPIVVNAGNPRSITSSIRRQYNRQWLYTRTVKPTHTHTRCSRPPYIGLYGENAHTHRSSGASSAAEPRNGHFYIGVISTNVCCYSGDKCQHNFKLEKNRKQIWNADSLGNPVVLIIF